MSTAHVAVLAALLALAACATAPDEEGAREGVFLVRFETTRGSFLVEVHPDWAPLGAARFRELVEEGYYDGCRFFRVKPGWVVQFGINGDPAVSSRWAESTIPDDPVRASNERGTMAFAMSSEPESRTTQVYVNLEENSARLDERGFAVFGRVVLGMDEVVEKITARHGERPDQSRIHAEGNAYLDAEFPGLDHIRKASVLPPGTRR
jgi:cyclophilin family peptidyl-prolyl cis-trans isomerase